MSPQIAPELTTREKILDAAEALFARHGFNGTSVRAIAAAAHVNLAASNYHFGPKESLIEAVFARRIRPLNAERVLLLDSVLHQAGEGPPDLAGVVEAFIGPALRMRLSPESGGEIFLKLMGRAHAEASDLMPQMLQNLFQETAQRFQEALMAALPEVPSVEVHWKFHFMIGTMAFVLAAPEVIERVSCGRCDLSDVEDIIERMTCFIVAGFRAPVPTAAEAVKGAVR